MNEEFGSDKRDAVRMELWQPCRSRFGRRVVLEEMAGRMNRSPDEGPIR